MQAVNEEDIHIVLHEIGHTFALDGGSFPSLACPCPWRIYLQAGHQANGWIDFYDWTPTGVSNFIMLAGSAMQITEFDEWMARDWWRHLKSRYSL